MLDPNAPTGANVVDAAPPADATGAEPSDARADAGSQKGDAGGHSGGLKAFPEAEGFGRNASGGRGGEVYKVTTLADSGAGSLREGLSKAGRTILFEVSGIRFRPGSRFEGDCCGDAWVAYQTSQLIFDHVSASYSSDEMLDFTGSTDITVQNSILSEPLSEVSNPRAGGKTVMGKYTDRISMYRTLIANSSQRNPLLMPLEGLSTTHQYEYANCYGFNLGSFALSTGNNESGAPIHMNIIGNTWHDPSNVGQSRRWVQLAGETNSLYFVSDDNFDSRYRTSAGGDVWNDITAIADDYASNFSVPQSKTYQASTAHALPLVSDGNVLLDGSVVWATLKSEFGVKLFRDAADLRIIAQIENDQAPDWTLGPLDENAFGTAYSALGAMAAVALDSDDDGIPDVFETQLGSDPHSADQNKDRDGDGYTNLEEYLNSLVQT